MGTGVQFKIVLSRRLPGAAGQEGQAMLLERINRISGRVVLWLSLVALSTVITGYFQPTQPDEGTGAHIFQLSIVALFLAVHVYLITADWRDRRRSLRGLRIPALALLLAFGALCYLEHFRAP